MKFLISACSVMFFCSIGFGQGKFFGGNSPSFYTGTAFVITTALSIDQIFIRAVPKDNGINIVWTNTKEITDELYVLERQEEETFLTIDTINYKNSSEEGNVYSFLDQNPNEGVNYYRLKQVDKDGNESFSKIVYASYIAGDLFLYPNPTSRNLYFSKYLINAEVSIFNQWGQIILHFSSNPVYDISSIPNGLYIVKVDVKDRQFYYKVIKN